MTTTENTQQEAATIPEIASRIDFEARAGGFYRAIVHLDKAATRELDNAGIDPKLRELIRIRASQLNGCAYCIDMHTKDARAIGESEQRIWMIPARRSAWLTGCWRLRTVWISW